MIRQNRSLSIMRPFLFLLATSLWVAAAPVADFQTALDQAKSRKAPIAVLIRGSDWNHAGEAAAKIWEDARFPGAVGSDTLLVSIDRKESPTDAEKEAAKRNEKCQPPYRSLPAVALYDSEGRMVAMFSGMAEIDAAGGLPTSVKSMTTVLTERDELWKRAAGARGVQQATLLGAGLDRMDIGLGPKNVYQPILDEIQKADPKDETGYVGKYTFSRDQLLGMVMDKAKKEEFVVAEAELAKWAQNPRLSPRQRQELHAARFALYQRWPAKKASSRTALEDMHKIDPSSDLGLAASSYLKQLKK